MSFNTFLEVIFKHQPKGIIKLKVANWILKDLMENGKLTFTEIMEKLKDHGEFSPKLIRKVLRVLRDLKILRLTIKQEKNTYAYEISKSFLDFLRDVDRDFYKKFFAKHEERE